MNVDSPIVHSAERSIDARPQFGRSRPCCMLSKRSGTRLVSAGRQSAIPWGVAGMIGLIVVIECFVARNWLDFTDPVSLSWRYSAAGRQDGITRLRFALPGG